MLRAQTTRKRTRHAAERPERGEDDSEEGGDGEFGGAEPGPSSLAGAHSSQVLQAFEAGGDSDDESFSADEAPENNAERSGPDPQPAELPSTSADDARVKRWTPQIRIIVMRAFVRYMHETKEEVTASLWDRLSVLLQDIASEAGQDRIPTAMAQADSIRLNIKKPLKIMGAAYDRWAGPRASRLPPTRLLFARPADSSPLCTGDEASFGQPATAAIVGRGGSPGQALSLRILAADPLI